MITTSASLQHKCIAFRESHSAQVRKRQNSNRRRLPRNLPQCSCHDGKLLTGTATNLTSASASREDDYITTSPSILAGVHLVRDANRRHHTLGRRRAALTMAQPYVRPLSPPHRPTCGPPSDRFQRHAPPCPPAVSGWPLVPLVASLRPANAPTARCQPAADMRLLGLSCCFDAVSL